MGLGVWQRLPGLTPGSISVHIPSVGIPSRDAGPWTASFRRALPAAAGVLALPGAAAASHLDGFVFDFTMPPPISGTEAWCRHPLPCFSSTVTMGATSSWSGRYLGTFGEETVSFEAIDALHIVALQNDRAYLSFDLLLTGGWSGNGVLPGNEPDLESFFTVVANGRTLLDSTFSTQGPIPQAYPGSFPQDSHPAGTGAVYRQATPLLDVYHFGLIFDFTPSFPNCCTDVAIAFSASFGSLYDAFPELKGTWGLDNVVVSSTPIPEPATGALVGLGLLLLAARKRSPGPPL